MKQKDKKKQVLLGRRHTWIDTQGHTHRVVFDKRTIEKPKTTWIVLSCVTLLALGIGVVATLTAPSNRRTTANYGSSSNGLTFVYKSTLSRDGNPTALVLTAGWHDELFVADERSVTLYDGEGVALDSWETEEDVPPTAMTFVSDENSELNGLLLVAFSDKIKSLRFSLDQVAPGEGNAVIFTGENAARGKKFETMATFPEANIRGLACSSERLFVADCSRERVLRYSLKKLISAAASDGQFPFPDCVIGESDSSSAYSGIKLGVSDCFSITYLASENELWVANSGLLRVDAFSASTGTFRPDHSSSYAGTLPPGCASPVAIAAASDRWLAGVDLVPKSDSENGEVGSSIRFFRFTGEQLGEITGEQFEQNSGGVIRDVAISPDSRNAYVLSSTGQVSVWSSER